MSVPVRVDVLDQQLSRYGCNPFLLTVGADGHPHAVSVQVSWEDGGFVTRAGSRTLANAADRPGVTLLWSPVGEDGFSLIVDGTASVEDDRVTLRPARAVLHRTLARAAADPAGSDCVTVSTQ